MKILSYALAINSSLLMHTPTQSMELKNTTAYKDIHHLLSSEEYRSNQFSDKNISFEKSKLLNHKDGSFTFQAHTLYSTGTRTIEKGRVKLTINTEFNDQHNQILLKTMHSGFGTDQKFTIEKIQITDLPTLPTPQPVLPEHQKDQTKSIITCATSNGNAEISNQDNGTSATIVQLNDKIANDCFWPLLIILYTAIKPSSLKKVLTTSIRLIANTFISQKNLKNTIKN